MKKIPLYCGIFLIMVWGASQKIALSLKGDDKIKKAPELVLTYSEKLDQCLDCAILNWEEFYRIYRPQFSELTDEALYQLYRELKR